MATRLRLKPEDIIVGLDLAGEQHQAVICRAAGERLTRFRVSHSLRGFDDLLMRTRLLAPQADRRRVFAFEATGHVWEALAHYLATHGEEYVIVNPLATFRLREARQMNRHKTDITDAEQIAELVRNDLVTETKLEAGPYLELRRAWGDVCPPAGRTSPSKDAAQPPALRGISRVAFSVERSICSGMSCRP
jgi:transposase